LEPAFDASGCRSEFFALSHGLEELEMRISRNAVSANPAGVISNVLEPETDIRIRDA
jgi:hypothetical protein